jgi:hypothetical protein
MADLSSLNMPSGRDPEDVYAGVEARGRALRNRRYAILGVAATVLVVAIAVPVASALGPGDQRIHAAGQPDADTGTSTTTIAQSDDTTAAPPNTATSPTTNTIARNATATTAAPTTTPASRYDPCPLHAIEATVATDRQTYPVGTHVAATGTLRNTSDRPCFMPAFTAADVYDTNGERVLMQTWTNDTASGGSQPVTPGRSRTYNWTWNQTTCSYTPDGQCGRANPGDYSIQLTWGSFGNAKTAKSGSFAVTAA